MERRAIRSWDTISKALWARDLRRAYTLLKSFHTDWATVPSLYHERLRSLAIIGTVLEDSKASRFRDELETVYGQVTKYEPAARKQFRESKGKEKIELPKEPSQMLLPEALSFFVTPAKDMREFHKAVEYAKTLHPANVKRVGPISYTLEQDLSSVTARGYSESSIEMLGEGHPGIMFLLREEDLIVFQVGRDPAQIVARSEGIFLIARSFDPREDVEPVMESIVFQLNDLFFPRSLAA